MKRPPITVGGLFAGVGGIEIGLERAGGFRPAWFVESDPDCARVLNACWPSVPVLPDVRATLDVPRPHVLAGGFPCQDISNAGKKKGLREGSRSSLWFAFADRIRDLRPYVVVVENVAALLTPRRGFDAVLGSLSALGYHAEWDVVSAFALGAPQLRERAFVVAWRRDFESRLRAARGDAGRDVARSCQVPGAVRGGRDRRALLGGDERDGGQSSRYEECGESAGGADRALVLSDAARGRRYDSSVARPGEDRPGRAGTVGGRGSSALPAAWRVFDKGILRRLAVANLSAGGPWPLFTESGVGRAPTRTPAGTYVVDAWESDEPRFLANCPSRGPRLRAIGNSVVPAVAEYVGRCILQAFPSLPWMKP